MTAPPATAPFAGASLRLAGLAARVMGWRPAEFWAATPAELACALAPPEGEIRPMSMADIETLLERERNG